jgi:hypothetical protein
LDEYYWHGTKLKNELEKTINIKQLKIASAYFSVYGLELLKQIISRNKLLKNQVKIYLSPEFSTANPGTLLDELCILCEVYIVFDIPFHPKVVYIKGSDNKLIFGSSNFTQGGIEKNVEFDIIKTLNSEDILRLETFFEFCKGKSRYVNEEIINDYKENQKYFNELRKLENQIKKRLYLSYKKDDPFNEEEFNIANYYFTYDDYEVFFPRNKRLDDILIKEKRKKVQEKLLKIHNNIYSQVKKLNLSCHWRKDNITSLIRPCVYNKGEVGWMGVRYGKSEVEIKTLNAGTQSKDEEFGFQKHACLQFSISSYGFEVNLFHAVSHDAVDRDYVHKMIGDNNYKKRIIGEIENLKGNNMVWKIFDTVNNDVEQQFVIDSENPKDFIDFYKHYDIDGKESFLSYFVEPDNPQLKDTNSISSMILKKFPLYIPLYKLMAFRITK